MPHAITLPNLSFVSQLLCAGVLAVSVQIPGQASSLLVSFTDPTGAGGIETFSLTPQSSGTLFDSEATGVTSLTVANNSAYWVSGTQVFSDSLTDQTGGGAKIPLPSVPFAGVTVDDIAVDAATGSYYVGWTAPGYGWFVAQYPANPSPTFTVFVNATTQVQGLTIVGQTAYWIEGTKVWSQNLDGTGKTQVQSFALGGVTLNDLAIDAAGHTYLLSATTAGLPPLIARYPLTPNASGTIFTFGSNHIPALTTAGDRAYWIDGSSVWSQNLNGTGLTLQATLPAQYTLTDLAVTVDTPTTAPEPASMAVVAGGLVAIMLLRRSRSVPFRTQCPKGGQTTRPSADPSC